MCINLPLLWQCLAGGCRCGGLRSRRLGSGCVYARRSACRRSTCRRNVCRQLLRLYLPRRCGWLLDYLRLVTFRHGARILRGIYLGYRALLGYRAGIDFKTKVLYVRDFLNGRSGWRGLHDGTKLSGRFRGDLAGRLWLVGGRRGRLYAGVGFGDLPDRRGLSDLRMGVGYCKQ